MNRFQSYLQLNKILNKEYSALQTNYPLIFKTAEWYIRINKTIGKHELKRIIAKQSKGDSKFKLFFWLIVFRFWNSRTAILHLQRLSAVYSITQNKLKKSGFCFIRNKGNSFIYTLINLKLNNIKWYQFVENLILDNNHNQLSKIEFQLDKIINEISKFLIKNNFRLIVTQDLHTDHGYILAKAAEKANIPSVEFAHCYTQDEFLVTILPVNGNYSILWTSELLKSIYQIIELEDKSKLKTFGYPKQINSDKKISKNKILLLFPGLQAKTKDERVTIKNKWIKLYEFLLFHLKLSEKDIIIRAHPGDQSDETNYIRNQYRKSLSKNQKSNDDLRNCKLVIGGASTVLVDAIHINIPAIQIIDFQSELLPKEIRRIQLNAFMRNELDLNSKELNDLNINEMFEKVHYEKFIDSLL